MFFCFLVSFWGFFFFFLVHGSLCCEWFHEDEGFSGLLNQLNRNMWVSTLKFLEHFKVCALQQAILYAFRSCKAFYFVSLLKRNQFWPMKQTAEVFCVFVVFTTSVHCVHRKCLNKWTKLMSSYAANPKWKMDPTPRTLCWSCGPSPSSSPDTSQVSTRVLLVCSLCVVQTNVHISSLRYFLQGYTHNRIRMHPEIHSLRFFYNIMFSDDYPTASCLLIQNSLLRMSFSALHVGVMVIDLF